MINLEKVQKAFTWHIRRVVYTAASLFLVSLVIVFLVNQPPALSKAIQQITPHLSWSFVGYIAIGFVVQTIGVAYGLITSTILLSLGLPPILVSSSVHATAVFTNGTSGWAHYRMGNINKKLFWHLLIPGIVGVLLGTLLLTSINGHLIKPFVAVYMLGMGIVVFSRSLKKKVRKQKTRNITPLALVGGFLDGVGGGGWSALITSTLISKGRTPRYTIGTVNTVKFFIAVISTGAFLSLVHLTPKDWMLIAGLLIGGVPASYFSAFLAARLQSKMLMRIVGVTIILLSSYMVGSVFYASIT
ncbi:sulfite exporter TauE/SafE family protein [Microscilla marina]|uniref:Probable membrane transporter protein n=1 Tax=Microscilla marina ATCC 23134 TaxID=313606 RepID=A1ZV67_MICM2|nr:sulfite exporter TauE/SafE family protein [Microscilla marina]EAY25723.1 conserved membrane protein YtnM [Microscilla marina ATCC 23134]